MTNERHRIEYEESSGNVFADLGLPNPEPELLKANLSLESFRAIQARKLTQAQAAKMLGIPQSHVSDLMCGRARAGGVFRRATDAVPGGART